MQMKRQLMQVRRSAFALWAAARECAEAGFPGIAEVIAEEASIEEHRERRRRRGWEDRREGGDDE